MEDVAPPDPPSTSDRIALRQFRPADASAISAACQVPDIPRFTMMPDTMSETQARAWVERGPEWWSRGVARFAITIPPFDHCVGQIGVHFDLPMRRAEAFYWLGPTARGHGYATEALNLVTDWAFRDFDIVRVQLVTHLDNDASQRVAQRCGFVREGVLRAWEPVKDDQPDLVMWSRLKSDQRTTN